jgi:hypothetical protein
MSRVKQVTPGSPFQFRSLRQHLSPLLKDVKTANLSLNPAADYKNNGLLVYETMHMFHGNTMANYWAESSSFKVKRPN